MKARWLNYLGQLRLYSLFDLILLLTAIQATLYGFVGGIAVHIGFLAYLEWCHKQEGREAIPERFGLPLLVVSLIFLGDSRIEYQNFFFAPATWYLIFSVIYAQKQKGYWGLVSPFARGVQIFCLTFLFAPWEISLLAAIAMLIRNVIGDLRDVVADRREGMKTWPVALGVKNDWLFLHLLATIATTWLWWYLSNDLLVVWPACLSAIIFATYYLTPRSSNQKALTKLQSLGRRLRLV